MKHESLKLAVEWHGRCMMSVTHNPEKVVDTAKIFEAYLSGAAEPPKIEDAAQGNVSRNPAKKKTTA
jgi:hypothetical protein